MELDESIDFVDSEAVNAVNFLSDSSGQNSKYCKETVK